MSKKYVYYVCLLGVIGFALSVSSARADVDGAGYMDNEIQAPEPVLVDHTYVPAYPPSDAVVDVPANCQKLYLHLLFPCRPDSVMELALEREYWSYIALIDSRGMYDWLHKTRNYARFSDTPNAGRIHMLRIFANLHVYADSPWIIDPFRSPYVLGAMESAKKATDLMPRSPNAWAFFWAIRNFTQFALGQKSAGVRSAEHMMDLEWEYGDWGAAGPIGAVAHLMGADDPAVVRRGIEYYDECFDRGVCRRETSIAPFQYLGTLVTQAEAYGFLGEYEKMHDLFDRVGEIAAERNWPFADQVEDLRYDMVRPGGFIEEWQRGRSTGIIRSPRGAAHQREACAFCHAGNYVPEHYYP
ncbi:MAG: hypothetical protein MJE77_22515 [Proteobacteria bacterium]|nr:hypothetical protein [Pseudomonadota bacterium]